MHQTIDNRLTRHGVSAIVLLAMTMAVFNCGGGGGNGDRSTRDQLRSDHARNPGAFNDKWGLPKK